MKSFDQLRIAAKSLAGKWAVLPAAGMAIAAFCLCFAGAVHTSVQQEKSQPYELGVAAETGSISDSSVATILEIEGVTEATALLEISATVQADEYSAELALIGINADYIARKFSQGGMFPDSGVMPYIIINEAALKQFKAEGGNTQNNDWYENSSTQSDAPEVDWLAAEVTIHVGEGERSVVAKICGILADGEENQEPAAYISLSAAKKLLLESGQDTGYTGARVRISNIGCADAVTKGISALGLTVTNSTADLQSGWDAKLKEMTYLIVIGGFCLLCCAALMAASRRISLYEKAQAYQALLWIGMLERDIRRMFVLQSAMISISGAAIGTWVSAVLPSFLTAGNSAETIYTLPVPVWAVVLSLGVCLIAGIVPVLLIRRKCLHYNLCR